MNTPLVFMRTEHVDHSQKLTEEVAMFNYLDAALVAAREVENLTRYKDRPKSLGAGRVGHPLAAAPWDRGCERALFFEKHQYPSDRPFPAKLYRIFDMGHAVENIGAENLRLAGFTVLTLDDYGKQFGFELARDSQDGHAHYKGFCDGVVVAGPARIGGKEDGLDLRYPFLWENKGMNNKKFEKFLSDGVERSHPHYYAQILQYQNFLQLYQNPALLTVENRDTGEMRVEFIRFNQKHCQAILDRAARVIAAKNPLQLARAADDFTKLPCKWCDYESSCRKAEESRPEANAHAQQSAPKWLNQSQKN